MPGTLSILSDTFSRVYGATIEALTDVGHGAATMPRRPSVARLDPVAVELEAADRIEDLDDPNQRRDAGHEGEPRWRGVERLDGRGSTPHPAGGGAMRSSTRARPTSGRGRPRRRAA